MALQKQQSTASPAGSAQHGLFAASLPFATAWFFAVRHINADR